MCQHCPYCIPECKNQYDKVLAEEAEEDRPCCANCASFKDECTSGDGWCYLLDKGVRCDTPACEKITDKQTTEEALRPNLRELFNCLNVVNVVTVPQLNVA